MPPAEEDCERAQPVPRRVEDDVTGSDQREHPLDLAPFVGSGRRKPRAKARAASVDAQLPPRLGVDEPERPGVRQLLLARIADLDRDDVMAAGELEQRSAPVARTAKVGHDDHDRALPGERPRRAAPSAPASPARFAAVRRRT